MCLSKDPELQVKYYRKNTKLKNLKLITMETSFQSKSIIQLYSNYDPELGIEMKRTDSEPMITENILGTET